MIPENQIFDLESYSQKILFDFFKNLEGIDYWVTASQSYVKKTNLLEDPAQWEGWFVQFDLESAKPINIKDIIRKISSWNQNDENGKSRKKKLRKLRSHDSGSSSNTNS